MAIASATRKAVAERAGFDCEYCRCSSHFSTGPYAVEHIQPREQGGTDDLDNLAWSCDGCNGHKAAATHAYDPQTEAWVPLYHPRRHTWLEHFGWSEDGLRVQGLTPTGRATVRCLRLNRCTVVNLRGALMALGRHPPEE